MNIVWFRRNRKLTSRVAVLESNMREREDAAVSAIMKAITENNYEGLVLITRYYEMMICIMFM